MSNVAAGKDTDDEGEVLNDVEKTLNSLNIALRSSKGEWRSFEDVLDEVAEKWEKFSDTERSHIATAIAGTRQQENFRAMMNNWDEVTRLVGVAADSTGSASERMEVYLDSIEAKTNKLKASWENFVMSLNQSESWGELLDWLSQFLDKLKYVDWKLVGITAGIGGVITMILKLLPAIKTLIATIKTGGILAGISSGGIIPILGLIATAIITISTAWKSANENAEQQIESIKEQKKALNEEKEDVKDLYKQYSELEGKSKYYTLTAEEKQKLVDVSKDLVEKYGLEASGVDTLTGQYILATDALKKYNDEAERQRRVLDIEEKNALKKDFDEKQNKMNQKHIKTIGYAGSYRTNTRVGITGDTYVGQQRILDEKEMKHVEDLTQMLANVLYDEDSWQKDYLGQQALKKEQAEYYQSVVESLVKDYGINLSEIPEGYDEVHKFSTKNDFVESIRGNVIEQQNTMKSATQSLAETATKYLNSEFSGKVSNNISEMMENAIKQYVNDGGGIGENFLEDYKNKFVNMVNAEGNNLTKIVDNYKKLQEKADLGTLTNGEYEEYQQGLRTYIELQKQAAEATGMNKEAVEKYINTLANDAFSNINTKLLELRENMSKATDGNGNNLFSEEQLQKFDAYTQRITGLNTKFKSGKISAKDYFTQLNQVVNSIDPTNLKEIESTFGNINNYMATLTATFQDSVKYINSIWTAFQGGGDSLEFLNNFLPAAQQVQDMAESFLKIEKSIDSIDLDTRDIDYSKDEKERYDITQSNEEIQQDLKTKLNVEANLDDIEKAKNFINELDGKSIDIAIEGIKDEPFKNLVEQVDNVTDGTADLTNNVEGLSNALGDLASLDFGNVDKAFETVSAAFDALPKDITSLVGTANQEVQNSAQQMAQWMINVANSDKEYAKTAQQHILETMGVTNEAQWGMSQENVNALATAYMADAQNTANFAEDANSIAQQAMSEAVKKLGGVLSKMGEAISNLDIEIPLSLDGLNETANVAGIPIPVKIPTIKTVFKIGGAGTKGLQGVGDALKSFGDTLQTDAVSNTIASNFTPVQANYTPKNIGDKKDSPSSSHTPSGGGSKKGSGSEYSAEDAASDLKDILQDIEDYEADIELDLEDQTEQLINQYNLKRNQLDSLKEELDYYDSIYDVTENTTKWLETQLKILDEESKKVAEIQNANDKIDKQRQKIYNENSKYNVQSWFDSEGNETLAYGNLLNSFEYRKNEIEKETAAAMRAEYNKVANSTDKDTISAAKDRIKQIEKDSEIKIKAIDKERDKVENIYNSVGQLNDAWKENQEAIREALQELNDKVKSIRDELIDDIMEQLERAVDKMNTSIEKDVTRLEQLKQVQESYNDILNDTIDTQQELEDELKANMDSYQYLDDTMRQLMFNEDDYKQLSGVIEGIQSDIAGIWEDHYNQIQNLTEDEMYKAEYITNETERQLAAKQKEYNLAKAELDVAKAQTNLNNVKNERNTRIFANGEWQWVIYNYAHTFSNKR